MKAKYILLFLLLILHLDVSMAQQTRFKTIVLTERGSWHEEFVVAALQWLDSISKKQNFEYTIINHPSEMDNKNWQDYQLFIQLNYPPYNWTPKSMENFIKYMQEGSGGWVGFHHASLLGEFDGYPIWPWFSNFLGGIRFKDYIAKKATATVHVEARKHPVMLGLPDSFAIPDDEWYTFDKDPRPNVFVLANVDENSYQPASDIKMGDHPVIWSNTKMKARNVYFLMGHSASLLQTKAFRQLFLNAILWAANKPKLPL